MVQKHFQVTEDSSPGDHTLRNTEVEPRVLVERKCTLGIGMARPSH